MRSSSWQQLLQLLLLGGIASRAQRTIASADLSSPLTPMRFPILECVGGSHGELLMWAPYRDHVRKAQADIGFKHLRGHGLLSDDLSTLL